MNNKEDNLKEQFDLELEKIKKEAIMSPVFRKKKTILWAIRSLIAIILYWIFWEHIWLRWTLLVYIPISLFSLLSIYGWNFLLKKKIAKTESKIIEAERNADELEVSKKEQI